MTLDSIGQTKINFRAARFNAPFVDCAENACGERGPDSDAPADLNDRTFGSHDRTAPLHDFRAFGIGAPGMNFGRLA
jgi:hypothetical protein